MTTSITLARDADTGHVILDHERAVSVARHILEPSDATLDISHAVACTGDALASALARYVLRTAAVSAAAAANELRRLVQS